MSYALTKGNADVIGIFGCAGPAKQGGLPGAVPFSPPDCQITLIGVQDGFVWAGDVGRRCRRPVRPAVAQLGQCS